MYVSMFGPVNKLPFLKSRAFVWTWWNMLMRSSLLSNIYPGVFCSAHQQCWAPPWMINMAFFIHYPLVKVWTDEWTKAFMKYECHTFKKTFLTNIHIFLLVLIVKWFSKYFGRQSEQQMDHHCVTHIKKNKKKQNRNRHPFLTVNLENVGNRRLRLWAKMLMWIIWWMVWQRQETVGGEQSELGRSHSIFPPFSSFSS